VKPVGVRGEITLGQFLKLSGAASTGGHAKVLILEGLVRVNGEIETRRGRGLADGDSVDVAGTAYQVEYRDQA
jgi:ribosome-associated protein